MFCYEEKLIKSRSGSGEIPLSISSDQRILRRKFPKWPAGSSMNRINKMRTKNFLIVLCCIIMTSLVLIIMGPSSVPSANDSTIRTIFSQTNQQFQHLKVSVGAH